jgi:hypothetical protein
MPKKTRTNLILTLAAVLVALVQMACPVPVEMMSEAEILEMTQAAALETSGPSMAQTMIPAIQSNEERQAIVNNPDLPRIWFDYSAATPGDLPMYRSALLGGIAVQNSGAAPWKAAMSTSVTRDYQALGALQPGTVAETTTFDGTYDPAQERLQGTIQHDVTITAEATAEYLAHTWTYRLTCQLDAQRVKGTTTIAGTCAGTATETRTVPAETDQNYQKEDAVTLNVSAELSEALWGNP